jgi:small subunit ribosomal protein S20
MAITSSAKKAIRSSAKKHVFNLRRKDAMRDTIKAFTKAVSSKNMAEAEKLLPSVNSVIDKALKRGVIKHNTADRKKSRLAKLLKKA